MKNPQLQKLLNFFHILGVLVIIILITASYIILTGANIAIVANSLRLGGLLDFGFGVEFLFALYGGVWIPLLLLILVNKWVKAD